MSLWFFCSSGFCAMRAPGIDTFVSGSESSLPQLIESVWPLVRNGNLEDLYLRNMTLLVYPLLYKILLLAFKKPGLCRQLPGFSVPCLPLTIFATSMSEPQCTSLCEITGMSASSSLVEVH